MGVTPKRRARHAPFRPLRLFGQAADPATRWVRIVLAEKLQHDAHFEPVDPRSPPDDLMALNPGLRLPMLLDREVDFITAMITSIAAVVKNPLPMLGFGFVVGLATLVALLPVFAGLLLVLPVLGHATWHLYRRATSPG